MQFFSKKVGIQQAQDIFENMTILVDWGLTNLVLIPKVSHPEMITQFWLISLCNTQYKLVSKTILQRLKLYIADIINPCQARFVSGRRTNDNIILVQEIILSLKLDLDKAYDLLEWSFIQESLEFFQVLPMLITLIMNMISSTRYSIQWNRSPLPEAIPSERVH